MTTSKWILSIIAASAASSYLTFHFNDASLGKSHAASNIQNSSHLQAANTSKQHLGFSDTNKTSANKREDCEKYIAEAGKALTDKDTDAAIDSPPRDFGTVEELQFSYEKKQNEISSFREFVKNAGDDALHVISENYSLEPIDPEWAGPKENELQALFSSNEVLQDSNPLELSCKSQNCRVVLSSYNEDQAESLYSAFKDEALRGSDENKKQIVTYFSDPNSGEIYLYLSKSTSRTLFDEGIE